MHDVPELYAHMTPEERGKFRKHKEEMDATLPDEWKLTEDKKQQLLSADAVAWDVETLPEAPKGLELEFTVKKFGVTFLSHVTHMGLYAVVQGQPVMAVITAPFTEDDVEFLDMLFSDPHIVKVAQYSCFDTKMVCGKYPITSPRNIHDTLVANALLRGAFGADRAFHRKSTLDDLGKLYGVHKRWAEFDTRATQEFFEFMKENRSRLHELPPKDVALYVLCDVWVTHEVYAAQLAIAQEMAEGRGWSAVWDQLKETMQVQEIENEWCTRGFPLDIPYMRWKLEFIRLRKMRLISYFLSLGCGDMTKDVQQLRYVFQICGCTPPKPFESRDNLRWWPAEMEHRLWTKAAIDAGRSGDIEKVRKNGSKYWSTGSDALEWYAKQEPQRIGILQYYNTLVATERTIIELLGHSQADGMIHPGMAVTANTGRTNSRGPNVLNINIKPPRPMALQDFTVSLQDFTDGKDVSPTLKPLIADDDEGRVHTATCRGMIVAPPGYVLLEFDASNAESRFQAVMAALLSGDIGLAQVFAQGLDLHTANAMAYFISEWTQIAETCGCGGVAPLCEEHKRLRDEAKAPYFASGYGAGIPKLSSQLMTPMDTVREMMNNYAAAYPGIEVAKNALSAEIMDSRKIMDGIRPRAHESAFVTLWNGRRVWIETLPDGKIKAYTGWNAIQQGGVGGIINRVVVKLTQWLDKQRDTLGFRSFVFQQEHDAVIVAVPADNVREMWEVGAYTAKLLMTQLPYDFTVIDGIHVPWPSGCNLHENESKWNWRWNPKAPSHIKGKPSPFPTIDENGNKIEITYPEAAAWVTMIKKAKSVLVNQHGEDNMAYRDLLVDSAPETGFTTNLEGEIVPCKWSVVENDLDAAFEAARIMARKIEKDVYSRKRVLTAQKFIKHMQDISEIKDRMAVFNEEMDRYDEAQRQWEDQISIEETN